MNKDIVKVNNNMPTLTDKDAMDILRHQYSVVVASEQSCFRERVRFGLMLIQWEGFLGESRGGAGGGASGGLKCWLEKNCPELPYYTAMAYKQMGAKALKTMGGGARVMAALLGNTEVQQPDGEVIVVTPDEQERCEKFYAEVDSRRKLEQMYCEYAREKKAIGRPSQGTVDYPAVRKSEAENAVAIIWPMVFPILKHRGAWMKAVTLVPTEKLREASETVAEFLSALQSELKTR